MLSKRSSPKASPKPSPKASPKAKSAISKTTSSGVLQRTSSKKVLQLSLSSDIQLQLNESISAGPRTVACAAPAVPTASKRAGMDVSCPISLPASPPARTLERESSLCVTGSLSNSSERGASVKAIDRAFALGARHGLSTSIDFNESRLDAELDEAVDRCRMLQLEVNAKREAFCKGMTSDSIADSDPLRTGAYSSAIAAGPHGGTQTALLSAGGGDMDGCEVLDQAERVLGYEGSVSNPRETTGAIGGLDLLISSSDVRPQNAAEAGAIMSAQLSVNSAQAASGLNGEVKPSKSAVANKDAALAEAIVKASGPASLVCRLRSSESEVCRAYHSCVLNLAWMCAKLNREHHVEPSAYVRAFASDQSAVPSFGFGGDADSAHHSALRGFFCDADAYSRAVCTFRELLATPELVEYRAEWFVNMLVEDVVRVQEVVKHWSKPIAEEQFSRIAFAVPSTA